MDTSPYLPFDPDSKVWEDIEPTYQKEGPNPLCSIMYDPKYSRAMDLYRSLVSAHSDSQPGPSKGLELSPRALALTEHLVRLNPSNYSIWQYRAKILIDSDYTIPGASTSPPSGSESSDGKGEPKERRREEALRKELDFLDVLANENMKSYQVWQHRRLIVSALGDPSRELAFIATNLERDSKNYHTWAYRQWVLAHFGGLGSPIARSVSQRGRAGSGSACFPELWDGELEYVDRLLDEDIRNNSAWNHRWFVIFGRRSCHFSREDRKGVRPPDEGGVQEQDTERIEHEMRELIRREQAFTKARISVSPNNASAWNYLRGIHTSSPFPVPLSSSLDFSTSLISTMTEAESDPSVDQFGRSPPMALEWCLDCHEESIKKRVQILRAEGKDGDDLERDREVGNSLATCRKLVQRLDVADPMRRRYHSYRFNSIKRILEARPSR
ncbi:protein prenylyltransferase [Violaceomyces palustris]|uniref:Protein prenylyltransferase n=1 Tax=Violaceomyces palustris TaxID=1673888 RepID=A0ACD0P8E6_9BASI|nr:protein prenylyltransferase [Violaceomyces palustris]